MSRNTAVFVGIVLITGLAVGVAYTQAPSWLKGTTDEKFNTLASIQPGLGTVMIEYGARFTNAYYAAKGGNWDLATYMLDEMIEIQEVAETTRPARAPLLKAFETNYLDKLVAAAKAKNWSQYQGLVPQIVGACNVCHAKTDHAYVVYRLPASPPAPLKMTR
ncbi:MAG TPA: hypothetical protein VGK88_02245 [bacterium]|jgi:hypothetical protein